MVIWKYWNQNSIGSSPDYFCARRKVVWEGSGEPCAKTTQRVWGLFFEVL